jgi:Co/Zn/Cd efflux system component
MSNCCDDKACEIEALRGRQSATLRLVLGVNLVLFAVVATAGFWQGSNALISDAADSLGDALVYTVSLFVVARSAHWKALTALGKGLIQLAFGLAAAGAVVYKLLHPTLPAAEVVSGVGLFSLAGNLTCAWLLLRHRDEDLNMNSVWLCSRNDVVNNIAVIAAGVLVGVLDSQWPDLVVGALIAALFLHTCYGVIGRALRELRKETLLPTPPSGT